MNNTLKYSLILYRMIIYQRFHLKRWFYQVLYSGTKWGKGIKFNGFPIFRLYGKTELGDNLVFTSTTRYNFVGLSKPCSIYVEPTGELSIGSNTGFSGVSVYCQQKIKIGCFCNFGGNVSVWDTDFHPLDFQKRRIHSTSDIAAAPVMIGDDVFVGANSIIMKGVTIGDRSIIGAGSVVTKDIPNDQIWAGNPARFVKSLI